MVDFKTLAEAVAKIGTLYPNNGFTFQDLGGKEVTYTFPTLAKDTQQRGVALQRLGLKKGDRLGMIVIDPEHFVLTFLAAVRIGVVPVPIYPPLYLGKLDSYFQQTEAILNSSQTRVLVASSRLVNVLSRLPANARTLEWLVEVEQLSQGCEEEPFQECEISPDDPAFLQYTSGTTMHPRGVIITHRNLISNVLGFVTSGLQVDPNRDKGITWLPLFHDMGLVGFVLGPICCGVSVVFIPTTRFIKNPTVWMETINLHRGTISFAPNFAFKLVTHRASDVDMGRWDLSCIKAIGCGAEPIHPETIREFMGLFQRCGLAPNAFLPAYGLAESTLAVTMKPLHEPVRFRRINRTMFEKKGVAEELDESTTNTTMALEHVSCGVPFPGHQLAILDRSERLMPECTEGEICLRGPSIAGGYMGETDKFKSAMRNGWFHTGDLGYLAQGELYVTGRIKDLIILNGHNIHPQTIEWLACTVEGVKKGSVVAFSRLGQLGEELVLVVEAWSRDTARITSAIEVAVQQSILIKPADIVCIKPGSLPRTSSGKLKRAQVRQQYLREGFRSLTVLSS
jgi:acyl-CoA synthetase (AMP-forming)/AMP-acid ligase II